MKLLGIICFSILFLSSLPILLFSTLNVLGYYKNNHQDPSFECINTINYENRRFKTYRTNGGAMTDFGIIVREEKTLFPGIIKSKKLFSQYPMDTVELKIEGNNLLIVDLWDKKNIKVVSLH
ncbi:MAG: hypothetical protein QM737_18535 [Ferruginibacter sp.]